MKIKLGTLLKNKHTNMVGEVHGVESVQIRIGESVTVYVIICEDGSATRANEFYVKKNWEVIG